MLGDELRKAREAAGLSQEDLAYKAKVDRTYVSMLERGKNSPTVEVLFRICRALRVSPSEVIARVEKASKVSATRR
jgi:transcriptional regulator with XRE-family HTH domain